MSDDAPGLDPIDVATDPGTTPSGAPSGVGDWPVGWYADPWTAGQYRFWNGREWTGDTHRSGPAGAYGGTSVWSTASAPTSGGFGAGGFGTGPAGAPVPPAYPNGRGPRITAIVAGLVALVLLAGAIGYSLESHSKSKSKSSVATTPTTSPDTSPSGAGSTPNTRDRAALAGLVVQQADVGTGRVVLLIPSGNRVTQPTLDLCNGTFASEKLRVARLQVAELDAGGGALLSTEAVAYRNPAATATAFAELRRVSAACPKGPVKSPVGEGTAQTRFNAPPDRAWPHTPSVERLAYSFVTTQAGTKSSSIAVYLRRGRVLLGLYFPHPADPQPAVAGQTSVQEIVGVFAARMARLPAAVVNGSA